MQMRKFFRSWFNPAAPTNPPVTVPDPAEIIVRKFNESAAARLALRERAAFRERVALSLRQWGEHHRPFLKAHDIDLFEHPDKGLFFYHLHRTTLISVGLDEVLYGDPVIRQVSFRYDENPQFGAEDIAKFVLGQALGDLL